jgi:hypothetical protein
MRMTPQRWFPKLERTRLVSLPRLWQWAEAWGIASAVDMGSSKMVAVHPNWWGLAKGKQWTTSINRFYCITTRFWGIQSNIQTKQPGLLYPHIDRSITKRLVMNISLWVNDIANLRSHTLPGGPKQYVSPSLFERAENHRCRTRKIILS